MLPSVADGSWPTRLDIGLCGEIFSATVDYFPGVNVMELWTAEEAARYLKLNVEVLRRKTRAREVPAVKMGRVWRFRRETIDEWIAQGCPSQRQQPTLFD